MCKNITHIPTLTCVCFQVFRKRVALKEVKFFILFVLLVSWCGEVVGTTIVCFNCLICCSRACICCGNLSYLEDMANCVIYHKRRERRQREGHDGTIQRVSDRVAGTVRGWFTLCVMNFNYNARFNTFALFLFTGVLYTFREHYAMTYCPWWLVCSRIDRLSADFV